MIPKSIAYTLLTSLLIFTFINNVAVAGNMTGISSVSRIGGSGNCAPELGGGLIDPSIAYCDHTYTWTNFPPEFAGLNVDYIRVSDADSSVGDYGLDMSIGASGSLLLLIDPSIDVPTQMPWVISDGYEFVPGFNLTLDQDGPLVLFDVWELEIQDPATSIVTGPQNDGSVSNYGVLFVNYESDLELIIEDEPDPYRLNSGEEWVRQYTITNLGPDPTDSTVVALSGNGINDSTFVSLETSPNSTFNTMGQFRWRMPTLDVMESATLTITRIFGPNQQTGVNIVTSNAVVESTWVFDPDVSNNLAEEFSTVLDFDNGISNVTRLGSSSNCAPTAGGALVENVLSYCDETFTWTDLPQEAEGLLIDYIVVANADAAEPDYGLSFDVEHAGSLLIMLETSIDVANDMPWMVADGYEFQPGINFMQNQDGPSALVDVWARDIDNPDNPVVTGPQNNGSVFNYGVAYVTDAADLVVTLESEPEPYQLDSGAEWIRSYRIENLGYSDVENVVVGISASGITDSTFVSLTTSPNSTFNDQGMFKWRMPVLEVGDVATMEIIRIFGPTQNTGFDIITSNVEIESLEGFDPNTSNNTASATTSVLGDELFQEGFEN